MNRLQQALTAAKHRGDLAFVPFVVLGDPDLPTSLRLIEALIDAGADALELGLPFSDPPADGPVVQAADLRALAAGTTPPAAFELLDELKRRRDVPVSLLIYYNLVLQYGVERFYARAAEAGVDAVLIADVPLEESAPTVAAARRHQVAPVCIASPLSSSERLRALTEVAEGYFYTVARVGITGEQGAVSGDLVHTLARLRAVTDLPALVGFGISTPAHVRAAAAAGADGVICGSAIIRRIAEHLGDEAAMIDAVSRYAREMKAACSGSLPKTGERPC